MLKTTSDIYGRELMRSTMGYATGDVLCVYTGRFSIDKNPLLLATAIAMLASQGLPYHGIFVGDGPQREAIAKLSNTRIVAFMRHGDLADLYRAVDVAAWPRQESMSMLDAASSGLPLVVSDQMGEQGRVEGNGLTYKENSVEDMARVLRSLSSAHVRRALGTLGRSKMESHFNWSSIAHSLVSDYRQAGAPA